MSSPGADLLSLQGVSKILPGVRALDNVSFSVAPGEVHGLVGENGAGKSTLMAVASGALRAEEGAVFIGGTLVDGDPGLARRLGLSIVRQEPALMPDLSVAENMLMGLPADKRPAMHDLSRWATKQLKLWSDDVPIQPSDRVSLLNPERRFIVEIVKALASEPRVLVLDEPTEHLGAADVGRLFGHVRRLVASGRSVVYISHRIREVREIADRLTVLRDGQGLGTYDARSLSEDEIVALIVGRSIEQQFPDKNAAGAEVLLTIDGLSGRGFRDVNLSVRRGEIFGLAGIDGNGQRDFLRALAGLNAPTSGTVNVAGRNVSSAGSARGFSYLPGDRHREGIFADLSIRKNFSIRSVARDARGLFVDTASEAARAQQAFEQLRVKAPGPHTPIGALSGGNQQKVVLAGVLATHPQVLLVDEPTQGVDVGARAEIYKILRDAAAGGLCVIVMSSDAAEIAGLCDRVGFFSRGNLVITLDETQVSESEITAAVLKSTAVRTHGGRHVGGLLRWASGDAAPVVMLMAAILILGGVVGFVNPFYLSSRSLAGMLTLIATLSLVGYGQQLLMLVGGIDLSVGPLMGLCAVVSSFFLTGDQGTAIHVAGFVAILATGLVVGLVNWLLVDPIKLHPMVATLATFMAIQAVSLILRPLPAGMIAGGIMLDLGSRIGFVPLTAVFALLLGVALEAVLHRARLGIFWRGFGSRPEAARMAGVSPIRVRLAAYVGCSLLSALASITMLQQVGIGDPRSGLGYTLTSIAAVVVGGTSLNGGRGTFLATLLGAVFITQINAVTSFLSLDQAWQNYLLGGMIVTAVTFYSLSRQKVLAI